MDGDSVSARREGQEALADGKNVKICLMSGIMTLDEGILQRRFARPVTDATMETCF